nr:MAG: hypothetical protein 1 [Procedovirinae sp.]
MEVSQTSAKLSAGEGFVAFINWLCNPWRNQRVVNKAIAFQADVDLIVDSEVLDDVNTCLEEAPVGQSQRTRATEEKAFKPITVDRTRRVRRTQRNKFVRHLVNEAKAEFGLPKATEANRLMVQMFLLRVCKNWGVVTAHTQSNVALALPLVFVPTEDDLIARALMNTHRTRTRVKGMVNTQAEGWWNNRFGIGTNTGLAFMAK